MNKVVVKNLIGQNGESLGAYVDYGAFCQMQSEYEEQIEKYKTEKEYYEKLCHNKTIECDDLIKGIEQFQKDNEVLYKTVNEKNEQIEKMKCCENCKNHYWNYGDLDCRLKYSCYDTDYDKWEMMK